MDPPCRHRVEYYIAEGDALIFRVTALMFCIRARSLLGLYGPTKFWVHERNPKARC
jgi:hypothetical protein